MIYDNGLLYLWPSSGPNRFSCFPFYENKPSTDTHPSTRSRVCLGRFVCWINNPWSMNHNDDDGHDNDDAQLIQESEICFSFVLLEFIYFSWFRVTIIYSFRVLLLFLNFWLPNCLLLCNTYAMWICIHQIQLIIEWHTIKWRYHWEFYSVS